MSHSYFRNTLIAILVAGGSSLACSAAAPMTWLDTQFSYDYGFVGGLEIAGVTSDSRHFDTTANPVVNRRSYSYSTISGVIQGSCDASFFDPAPFGASQYGFNLNTSVNYSAFRPGTGDPDPSTRTLWMSAKHSHVFRVTDPMLALGIEFGGEAQPWTLAVLESGTWNGSVFTPSGQVFDFHNAPLSTTLQPGDYRVRAELAYTWQVTGPQYVGSIFNWILTPADVPAPSAAALLGVGGLMAVRRRR